MNLNQTWNNERYRSLFSSLGLILRKAHELGGFLNRGSKIPTIVNIVTPKTGLFLETTNYEWSKQPNRKHKDQRDNTTAAMMVERSCNCEPSADRILSRMPEQTSQLPTTKLRELLLRT